MVSVESVPPSADVAISTKNTFIHVHGQNFVSPGQEHNNIVTQSAPPVYRYPEPDNLPSTPEVWSVKPMPPVEEEETNGKVVADQKGPFPTLGLDDDTQPVITDPDDKETGSTTTSNGLSANARPFVPSKKQTNGGNAAQLTTPHEKACADSLKAALAALFRDTGGVMFMCTRFGPYAFSVRLRMPSGADLRECANQIAYKKNYPSQFFVHESSVALPVVHLTVHYNDGSFGGTNSWDICWDFVKNGECKRGASCRWPHIPGAYFTIALENAP
jgi:hypothetical protein